MSIKGQKVIKTFEGENTPEDFEFPSIENIMANGVKDKGRNNNSVTTRNCGRILKTV